MKIEEAFALLEEHNKLASQVKAKPLPPTKVQIAKTQPIVRAVIPVVEEIVEPKADKKVKNYSLAPLLSIFGITFTLVALVMASILPTPILKIVGVLVAIIAGGTVALIDFKRVTKKEKQHIFHATLEYLGFRESEEDFYETVASEEIAEAVEIRGIEILEDPEEIESIDHDYEKAYRAYEKELAVYNSFQRKVALSLKKIEESIDTVNERAKSWKIEIDYRTKMVKKVNHKRGSIVFDYEADPSEDVHFYGKKSEVSPVAELNLVTHELDGDTQPLQQLKAS